jgi:predicted Zn-dependent protease
MEYLHAIAKRFRATAPSADYWSLRLVSEETDHLAVRQGVTEPSALGSSLGAMLTLVQGGGIGYGATSDLSPTGLAAAWARAARWAERHAQLGLFGTDRYPRSSLRADYASPVAEPWESLSLMDKLDLLHEACVALEIDPRIVDNSAWLGRRLVRQLLVTSDGGEVRHLSDQVSSGLMAVANAGSQTQTRTGGGADWGGQGGLERLARVGFREDARRLAEEALALLAAPECPAGTRDLILLPSQMVLQIHESIGHPLELDRILGDERNYAGTSFVTPDMFGTYRYGSELLSVTFDPGVPGELASAAADDEGSPAERHYLIRAGILERPLGGGCPRRGRGSPGLPPPAPAPGTARPSIAWPISIWSPATPAWRNSSPGLSMASSWTPIAPGPSMTAATSSSSAVSWAG